MNDNHNRRQSDDIDRYVGLRIRERRIMLGLTQQDLADQIGVTYQQAHKYEKGINRISAGRLYEIARVLGTGVGHFYEGLEQTNSGEMDGMQRRSLEIARYFAQIPNERHQAALSNLARALTNP
ncbi:MAG: helix-turn-helix domain-containing protein [Rhodospirillales bacterium]|nr:helix-turn-helix domain-containing protein [Rhodospirillales bacterium]MCW8970720.1 helix-turn-helix domain-containing protein [Rhodospirillales bacterium]